MTPVPEQPTRGSILAWILSQPVVKQLEILSAHQRAIAALNHLESTIAYAGGLPRISNTIAILSETEASIRASDSVRAARDRTMGRSTPDRPGGRR